MDLSNCNILFLTRCMGTGGTEKVILQLCDILKSNVKSISVCSSGGDSVAELEKRNIPHFSIPDFERKDFITIIKTFMQLKRIIKEKQINFVHIHSRMGAFYMYFLKKILHIKYGVTAHTVFNNYKYLTKLSYKKVPIACCGKGVYDNIVNFFKIDKRNVVLITNSILPSENNEGQIKFDNDNFKLGAFGRLCDIKRIDILIKSMGISPLNGKRAHLYIVGNGEEEYQLKELVHKENLESRITFLGYRKDAYEIMRQMDIVVLSSVIEGLPLVLIEALSLGKPIVATNIPGTADIVIPGYNGYLVDINDIKSFSEKISELIDDREVLNKFSKNSIELFKNVFSYDIFTKKYLEFYKNI